MRHLPAVLALVLPLAGCVVPPDGGYAGEGGYPGYSYNSGAPTYVVEGVRQPLIYYGGSWGYYDTYRRFHRAPDHVHRQLEYRHPAGGGGYRPFFGGGYTRPAEAPRYGTNQGGYRPAATGYSGYRAPTPAYAAPRHATPTYAAPTPAYATPRHAAPTYAAPQHTAPQHTTQRPTSSSGQSSGTHRRRDDERR